MRISSGNDWFDLVYVLSVLIGSGLFIFKPWRTKTKEEIADSKKVVSFGSKYGRTWYETKGQKDFEAKYWLFGIIVTFLIIIVPWILESIGWV
ncbi:MAG: hypothetical protein AAGH46_07445 [Bacteroidota bacterium]